MEKEWIVVTTDGKEVKVKDSIMKLFRCLELGEYDGTTIPLDLTESEMNLIVAFGLGHIPQYGYEERPRNTNFLDWEDGFFAGIPDQEQIFKLIMKANQFDKPLLTLTCAYVALLIRGKSPEEIRQAFSKNV